MGNIEAHDFAPVRADERHVLNLGRKVTPKQYVRHLNGQPHEACLTELPWSIRDSVCLYEKMTIAFNAITEIPVELPLRLPHLSCLHLNHNKLTSLPESFGLFFHLKELQLQHNKLSHLPDSFVHLVKLEKIDLSYNDLRMLHQDLGMMESLKKLNVIHNKLVELPVSLGSPSCPIAVILAHQNHLENPSQAICNKGSSSTLQCLRKMYTSIKSEAKPPPVNVFPRCCSNRSKSEVLNPHSAQIQYIQEQTNTLHTTNKIKAPLLPPPDASSHNPFELQDKIIGLIYGAAIGDAIGISCQMMSDDEVLFHYGSDEEDLEYDKIVQDEHRVLWRQGDWTCNFDQLMLVLESLVSWGGVVDELEFAQRLKAWTNHGFPELGDSSGVVTSPIMHQVISHPSFTKEPHSVASLVFHQHKPVDNGISSSPDKECGDSNGIFSSHDKECDSNGVSSGHDKECDSNGVSSGHDKELEDCPSPLPPSPTPFTNRPHPPLRRLSSSSSSLPSLSMYSHTEMAQKLVDNTSSSSSTVCVCDDNASVVRTAILGVPNFQDLGEVEGNALRICRTTHTDNKCLASCIVISSIVSLLLQGGQSSSKESETPSGSGSEFTKRLEDIFARAASHLSSDIDRNELCSLKGQTYISSFDARQSKRMRHAYNLVHIAVIALMWEGDFKSLISQVTRMGGDSSSNASTAGAIMGCRVGYSHLPSHWLTSLRKRQVTWLNTRINHLLDIMGSP